ncbi:hypothetical protein Acr_24g0001200 [Actinidia rufa]|uniref:P-loop containing nucleoside triphosphate hydrolases superfamily protein n=1 Tax=Actinidia rufa TaxID=165716 RepID=A0A7J0GSX3_9ERIC|nr:hypothetical protein Acr_24g0001200 [Actinidia rufa]
MKNQIPFGEQDQADQPPASTLCWWRTAAESGRHKVGEEFSDLSGLTPRLKVIRELERLALVAPEGLDDLRHKLLTYRSGDFWLPTGGIKKEEMEIPPLITVSVGGSSNYTTMYMEEHNVLRSMRNGFCMYDTRGFDCYEMSEGLEEVKAWVADGVRHYQLCSRPGDKEPCGGVALSMGSQLSSSRFAKRQVNCVMVVADLAEINKGFKDGDLKRIEATRELFQCPSIRKSNENPILILTHGDMLSCEERINARLKIGILPEESDPVTAFALTEAIYRALLQSDRTHLPKRKLKDWVLTFLSWIMCSIAAFFAMLALFFSKLGCNKKKL